MSDLLDMDLGADEIFTPSARIIDLDERIPEEDVLVEKKHHKWSGAKSIILSIVVLVIVIIFALFIYSMIQKSRINNQISSIGQDLFGTASNQQSLVPTSGLASPSTVFPLNLFGSSGPSSPRTSSTISANGPFNSSMGMPQPSTPNGPAFLVENPQHTLMVPSSAKSNSYGGPNSPLGQGGFNNEVGQNRVHFYYDGEKNKSSRRMDKEYQRLEKYCARDRFTGQYGKVKFHRCDVSKPEGRQYANQMNLVGGGAKKQYPFCTFARRGHYEESPIGVNDSQAKDMLKGMVQNLKSEKVQSCFLPYLWLRHHLRHLSRTTNKDIKCFHFHPLIAILIVLVIATVSIINVLIYCFNLRPYDGNYYKGNNCNNIVIQLI